MPSYKCINCGKVFTSYNKNPKFCSVLCKGDYQAPKIDIAEVNRLYSMNHTQTEIGKMLGVSQKTIHKAMKRHSIKTRIPAKRDQFGDKNHQWKGDDATIEAFHRRLYSRHGKPRKCSVCGTEDDAKHYDYANLSGDYKNIEDYAPMCRSCHWKYDKKINNIHNNGERREDA